MNLKPIRKLIDDEFEHTIWFQLREKFKKSNILAEVSEEVEAEVNQIDFIDFLIAAALANLNYEPQTNS